MDTRKLLTIAVIGTATLLRGADWPTKSGNPQRDGWARGERSIVKSEVQGLRLLYQRKLDNQSVGLDSLTSPIVLSNLISYRGFKEILFVASSSGTVYAIDADLNQLLWKTRFEGGSDQSLASATSTCPGGLTASLAIAGGSSPFGGFRARKKKEESVAQGGPGVGPGQGGAAHRPAKTPDHPVASDGLFSTAFGKNGYVFAIDGDGDLRFVRQSDGNDRALPPIPFLPANSKVSAINVSGTTLYAATLDQCGGHPNALYAIDLGSAGNHVMVFPTGGSGLAGEGGTAAGLNGTIYAQISNGHGDVAGKYSDTVLALNPQDLTVADYFTPAATAQHGPPRLGITPSVFRWKDKDLLVAAGRDGTLYLLDAASLGGPDHHTPLSKTEPLIDKSKGSPEAGFWGDFATWEDTDSRTRWVYAAFKGTPASEARAPSEDRRKGGVMAFTLEDQAGKPVLKWQWTSRDMQAPASPITTNSVVFALSTGQDHSGPASAISGHAVLYALDGATGKELFSSGNDADTFSHGSGLALANGRVYFTTYNNTVYCYGFPALQPQLTER